MIRDTIFSTISSTLSIPRQDLHEDIKLLDLSQDSIKLFELFLQLENYLGKTFEFEDVSSMETIGDVIVLTQNSLTTK